MLMYSYKFIFPFDLIKFAKFFLSFFPLSFDELIKFKLESFSDFKLIGLLKFRIWLLLLLLFKCCWVNLDSLEMFIFSLLFCVGLLFSEKNKYVFFIKGCLFLSLLIILVFSVIYVKIKNFIIHFLFF